MFKKVALLGLVLLIIGAILISIMPQKVKVSNELSDRSKEFIKKQEQNNESRFSGLEKKGVEKGQRFSVGKCFTIAIPFGVTNYRPKEECGAYFSFDRPKGTLVVFTEPSKDSDLKKASGYSLRSQTPNQYEPKEIQVGSSSYAGFIDKNENYSITLYRYVNGQFFILTLSLPHEDEEALSQILSSVEFN